MKYADLHDLSEDGRIETIARVIATGKSVAFIVEDDDKADRYLEKLRAVDPRVTVLARGKGPVAGTIAVKVGIGGGAA